MTKIVKHVSGRSGWQPEVVVMISFPRPIASFLPDLRISRRAGGRLDRFLTAVQGASRSGRGSSSENRLRASVVYSRGAVAVAALVSMGVGEAGADLTVGDSLNRYSLFGLERVSIGYRANTAQGGWVGSDYFVLQGENSIRSQVTAGQFDVVGTLDTVWGHIRVNRNMGGAGFYNARFDSGASVRGTVAMQHNVRIDQGLKIGGGSLVMDAWANPSNVFAGNPFNNGATTSFTSANTIPGVSWTAEPAVDLYLTLPDTAVTPGTLAITDPGQDRTWKCAANPQQPVPGCFAADSVLPPGRYGDVTVRFGATLYLGEGVYEFNSLTMQNSTVANPTRLLALQPNGARTVVLVKNGVTIGNNMASRVAVIAPSLYTKGYGTDSSKFAGGTMLFYSEQSLTLANYLDVWATVVSPNNTVTIRQTVRLYGQIFAKRIQVDNDFRGTDGAFIPYFPKKPVINVKNFDAVVTEGNPTDPARYAKFLLTMDHVNGLPVKVYYHTMVAGTGPGYAKEGADFTKVTKDSITIDPTFLHDTIFVRITSDLAYEPTETFRVVLDSSLYGTLGPNPVATGTIYDNDPPGLFRFANVLDSASEATPKPTIAVVLNTAQTDTLKVDVVIKSGTASGLGNDYTFHDTTLAFAPGVTSVSLGNFTVVDDQRFEATETVVFALRNPVTGLLDSTGTADTVHTQRIVDNDPMPSIAFNAPSPSRVAAWPVTELDVGSPTTMKVLVTLVDTLGVPLTDSQLPEVSMTYAWHTTDYTATLADGDYVQPTDLVRVFPVGKLTDTLRVVVNGDNHYEGTERIAFYSDTAQFVNLNRGKSSPLPRNPGQPTFYGVINDNDPAPALKLTTTSVTEPDAPATVNQRFFVTLVNPSTGAAYPDTSWLPRVKVSYKRSFRDSTALVGADYDTLGLSISDTIFAGSFSDAFDVKVLGDDRYEGTEAYVATIVPGLNANASSTQNVLSAPGVILDDETAPYVCIADTATTEKDANFAVPVRVFLSNSATCASVLDAATQAPELAVKFNWGTSHGTAWPNTDYLGVTQAATVDSVARLRVSKNLAVTIVGDDTYEPTENFTVNLASLVNGQSGRPTGTVTIADDEVPPTIASITSLDSLEGHSSSKWWHFKVKMSAKSEVPMVFTWSTANLVLSDSSAASSGEDYTAVASTTVTIPVGSDSAFLDVEIKGDLKHEKDEVFGIAVTPDSGITATGSVATATGTIRDDDDAPVIASITGVALPEGNSGTKTFAFKLKLSAPSGLVSTITWSTVAGAIGLDSAKAVEDYADSTNRTIVIPVGSDEAILNVTVNGDTKYEKDESFRVVATSGIGLTASSKSATGTILNDDDKPTVRILDASDVTEPASYGDRDDATFKLVLSAKSGLDVAVTWATLDSSASHVAKDYKDTGSTVVFRADLDSVLSVTVPVLGDSLDEPTETFWAIISNATYASRGGATDSARAHIVDNDTAPAIHVESATVGEPLSGSTTVSVMVRIDRPTAFPVSFRWGTRDSTALHGAGDYDSTGGDTTIPAGATNVTLSVRVNADAIANEFSEVFRVALSQVVGASRVDTVGDVAIVDRPDLPHVRIDSARFVVEDPTWLSFPVELDRVSAVPVRVRWRSVGLNATAGKDFVDTAGLIAIPAGSLRDTVRVRVLEDALFEPDPESLLVVLSDPESLVIAKDRDRGIVVDDNDTPPVAIDSADPVHEGGTALVPVRLLNESADTVFVWWHTVDSTAKAPADFVAGSGRLVFLPGEKSLKVSVSTLVDSIWEPTEMFQVRIDSVKGGFLQDSSETGRRGNANLLEEGDYPTVSFDMRDTAVVESKAGDVPVKVKLSRAASIPLKVGVVVDAASVASRDLDYALRNLSTDTLEIPALSTSASFVARVIDDSLDEVDELVRLGLSKVGGPAALGKTTWDLTILDDDSAPAVRFDVDSQKVPESVGEVTVRATLERPSAKVIDVWFSVGGTASADGVDHELKPFHLHFDAGATSATVVFDVVDDVIDEPDETVTVTLDSARNGNLTAPTRQIVVILDNDDAPRARFVDTLQTVKENVGTVSFPIRLDHPSSQDVVLRVAVRGSAILDSLRKGSDAVLDSDVVYEVRIAAGDTAASFEIRVINDGRVESTEDVRLSMTGGTGAEQSFTATARLLIEDDDRYPDVEITRPADSLRTKDSTQRVAWTWDDVAQPEKDTVLKEGWNRIERCATDTAGNTACDQVHVWGDFTAPSIEITRPKDDFLTNDPNIRICWTVVDSGATWRRVDSSCIDTVVSEGPHVFVREACDSVGNCSRDSVSGRVDLTPPTGVFTYPPDSSHVRVLEQPGRIRWIDGGDTIWVDTVLTMRNFGWNTFTATRRDSAGNVGTATVTVYYEAPQVQDGWYLDSDGDGRIDAVVVEFDAPWESDTMPTFTFELGDETRTAKADTGSWYSAGTRGVPAEDSKGDVVVDSKGDTVYLAPGIPMTDSDGEAIVDPTTGKPVTSPVGTVWRDASGKPVYDQNGLEMYRVPGPGTADRGRVVVHLPDPFDYGITSVARGDSGTLKVVLSVVDTAGEPVATSFEARFPLADSVAPIIAKAVVVRTESYAGKDSLYITPSESIQFDSTGSWIEIFGRDSAWHVVPAESLAVLPDGRIVILVEPGEDGSVRPDLKVRFGTGVTDTLGNRAHPSDSGWTTKVEGGPRPPLLDLGLPDPVKSVPSSEKNVHREGGFVIRATNSKDTTGYQWWKPGEGYATGSDPEISSVCPDIKACTGIRLYVNRPVRMFLYIYDLSGTFVIRNDVQITKEDIDGLKADKLDRVRIEIDWNMRGQDGRIVGSGIYLWRIVSYVQDPEGHGSYMTNQVVKLGVKSSLE